MIKGAQTMLRIWLFVGCMAILVFGGCGDNPSSSSGTTTTFAVSIANIASEYNIMSSGVFNTPVGAGSPAPIASGEAYEFDFTAGPGSKLSLAVMFVQSNDLFYSSDGTGIELFDMSGNQVTGDITSQLQLWDAGTEANEAPGAGPNQAPRQSGPNTGTVDSDNTVRLVNDSFAYPTAADAIQLTLMSTGPTAFTARLEVAAPTRRFPASGVFNTPVGATNPGVIGPGDAYEFSFDAASGSKLSFATMFVQSNDLFYSPGEAGIELFDTGGNPISGDVTAQIKLWDAGTEVNQEPGLGTDQAPRQTSANTGAVDGNATVRIATDDFSNLPAVTDVIRVTLTSTSSTGFTVRIDNVSTSTTLTTSDTNTHAVPLAPGVWVVHTDNAPLFTTGQMDQGDGLEALAEDGGVTMLNAALAADTGLNVLVSPGVWAVHTGTGPLFTTGQADRGDGLEDIAEDGDPGTLQTALASMAGVGSPFSPGVWVVHTGTGPLFTTGQADRGDGLEGIAEDGDPSTLGTAIATQSEIQSSGVFNTPVGAGAAGVIASGQAYEFTITAVPDDKLSFALMYVQSNDLFISPGEAGISLFNNTQPITGDVTSQLQLWDAGTEVNEEPGVGLNQPIRQSGANTGPVENGMVKLVNDGFTYSALTDIIRVTVTPQ